MSPEPGPDALTSQMESLKRDVSAELRREIETGLTRIRDENYRSAVERAERHSGYMRNWLALLTLTITVAFVVFGILGWTRFSDIAADRKEIAAKDEEVRTLASEVQQKVRTIDDSIASIQNYQTRVADLDQKMTGIEKRSEQADQFLSAAVKRASDVATQTHSDLQSSIRSGVLGDFPFVSSASLVSGPTESLIQGMKFGDSKGHVYVEVASAGLGITLQSPMPLEINPQYRKWTDTEITLVLSPADYQTIKNAHAKTLSSSFVSGTQSGAAVNLLEGLNPSTYLSLVVETSDGRRSLSLSSQPVIWP